MIESKTLGSSPGSKRTYSYVYSMQSFKKLIDHISRTGRGPKNVEEFMALGLAPNATDAAQCLNVARKFRMMDDEGTLSDIGRKFRLEKTRAEACEIILQEQFPELNGVLKEYPGQFPKDQLTEHLMMRDQINSESAIAKVLAIVKELNQGFANKPSKTKEKGTRKSSEKGPKVLQSTLTSLPKPGEPTIEHASKEQSTLIEPPLQTVAPSKNEPTVVNPQSPREPPTSNPLREDNIETVPLAIHVEIDHQWSKEQINLVFDRAEKFLKQLKSDE